MSIELHVWPTPNGYKVSIALEEMDLPYTVHPVNIGAGDQFKPDFLKIAPNNRMPAIVDPDGPNGEPISLFESGAILIYLAEKTGQFRPTDSAEWYSHVQWLMWQMGGVGPMFGQAGHFILYAAEKVPYGIERYRNEAKRLLKVADTRLGETQFLGSDAYGVADMASFPWIRNAPKYDIDLAAFPNVQRWFEAINSRPAVKRGLALLADKVRPAGQPMSDEERAHLYGRKP
jgi:GST-like protein